MSLRFRAFFPNFISNHSICILAIPVGPRPIFLSPTAVFRHAEISENKVLAEDELALSVEIVSGSIRSGRERTDPDLIV